MEDEDLQDYYDGDEALSSWQVMTQSIAKPNHHGSACTLFSGPF